MSYWPHLMAAMVGAGLTVQVGMNATVRFAIGSPVLAAVVNFVIGLAALLPAVPAGHADQLSAHQHAGAGHDARTDRLPQAEIDPVLGSHITDGGHPGHKGRPREVGCFQGGYGQRRIQ